MDQIKKFFISSQLFGYLVLVWSASNNYQIVNWSVRWRWLIPGLSDHLFKWYPTWPNHQVLSQIPGDHVWRGGGNLWTPLSAGAGHLVVSSAGSNSDSSRQVEPRRMRARAPSKLSSQPCLHLDLYLFLDLYLHFYLFWYCATFPIYLHFCKKHIMEKKRS